MSWEATREKRLILEGLVRFQHGRCAYCGVRMILADDHVKDSDRHLIATEDHLEPIWRGGRDDHENRCASCARCNELKGAVDLATFIRLRWNAPALDDARRRARDASRTASKGGGPAGPPALGASAEPRRGSPGHDEVVGPGVRR